ncbi:MULTISPECIES: glycosyltransferase family 4 protein [Cobetia]|uniref:Glycosyltransferase family 4 protein n=1 Tax=Cobetia crustatorum TaxID=553385 RepID=A0A558HNN2_9GAMM|nr:MULTISPECIES: glycosyltransferase family 4 protein [Cobetia]TVU70745.1 glycosyltransferase family 4 protein [Cobetia crustatorum]
MTSRKHVLFYTGAQSRTGGTERACADTANMLAASGEYRVEVISEYGPAESPYPLHKDIVHESLHPERSHLGALRGVLLFIRLLLMVMSKRPDVVVVVESIGFLPFLLPSYLCRRTRYICWEHFNATSDLGVARRDTARRLAARRADRVVVLSHEDREYWERLHPAARERLSVVPNLNPLEHVLGQRQASPAVEREASRATPHVAVAVGRLDPQKGFDLLLDAWAAIPAATREHWVLRIVGEGNCRTELQAQAEALGIAAQVQMPGQSSDIRLEYAAADLFVLSSRFEGFGLVLVEALSCGVPCVSFECPAGPREIIKHGVNGYLVRSGDVVLLTHQLGEVMADDAVLAKLRANVDYGLERFSRRTVEASWRGVLQELESPTLMRAI